MGRAILAHSGVIWRGLAPGISRRRSTFQGQGVVSKVDYKGQKLASLNVKGQVKGVDKTTQQLCKEAVDSQRLASDSCGSTSEPTRIQPDSFNLGFSSLGNDWEWVRSWECEELGPQPVRSLMSKEGLGSAYLLWSEVLKAPTPVIYWIQNHCRLPLQYMPTPFELANLKST